MASSGRYGAGATIGMAKNASLFSEINQQKGRKIESPLTANINFRLRF